MTELDFFGYFATTFILLGTWNTVGKGYEGWGLRLFGSLIWAYIGVRIGMPALWISELVFCFLAYKGYTQWKKQHDAQLELVEFILEEQEPNEYLKAMAEEYWANQPKIGKFGMPYYETK